MNTIAVSQKGFDISTLFSQLQLIKHHVIKHHELWHQKYTPAWSSRTRWTTMKKIDQYNLKKIEQIAGHYREVLSLIGEDPTREGLEKNTRACCQGNAVPYPRL